MDNRGFTHGEGKPGFPYQSMNGNYPGVYYPGQEMGIPYGQYAPGSAEVQFSEQCAIPQQVAPVAGNMSYGFGAHPYMQHYRQQQAHIMQAAYNNAQHQSRGTNPQQIADSIYNMAAHAYNYQQQNPSVPQAMPNPYSPGTNGHTLSVRTGHSPANSLHSPAGSTHSIGERPMLSPHVQSNAQMYNYHQSNHQSNNRHTQQHAPQPTMNYYGNGGHNAAPINGCMTSDLDHRQSVERLAAISHPSEQFNCVPQKLSPAATGNSNLVSSQSQFYQQGVSINNIAAPITCQHTPAAAAVVNTRRLSTQCLEKNVIMPTKTIDKQVNLTLAPSLPQCAKAVTLEATKSKTVDSTILVSSEKQSLALEENVSKEKDLTEEEEEAKPKEAAADSGIDSEQVDKDNEEEHDTSTTSNKSENSPQPVKNTSDIHNDSFEQVDTTVQSPGERTVHCTDHHVNESRLKAEEVQSSTPNDNSEIPASNISCESNVVDESEKLSISTENEAVAELESQQHSSYLPSDLNESFRSSSSVENTTNSLSNSCSSKQSMGDESRLPPRKRKQQLSEHTESLSVPVPFKKRGRPSKEAIRIREAAKSTVETVQLTTDRVEKEHQLNILGPLPIKDKQISSKDNVKKPVHSGTLLQSPKFNPGVKVAKDEHHKDLLLQTKTIEKKEIDHPVHDEKKSAVSEQKSNAVLVSPPKKPKASVSEMQKALMRVVSSDTGEVFYSGKRKRGRPPGSKNKKTRLLDYRARSNSASSSAKGQFPVQNLPSDYPPRSMEISQTNAVESSTADPKSTPSTSLTTTTFQSQKLSSSVQNRVKSLHIRKSKNVIPKCIVAATDLKLPVSSDQWVCTFCNQISNYKDMGDLFGGYNVQPNMSLAAKVIAHRKTSDLRQQQLTDTASGPTNEIWFHEKCIIWAPGVYMVGGKLYGIYDAITAAFQTACSLCKRKGAILGCFCKGCTHRYHIHCALSAECLLNEENFSMLCTKHKDKKIVLM